jgi:hypothetical protein
MTFSILEMIMGMVVESITDDDSSTSEQPDFVEHPDPLIAHPDDLPTQLLIVLDTFPDVQFDYVATLFQIHENDVAEVIESLASANGAYPKESNIEAPAGEEREVVVKRSCSAAPAYDFTSSSSFEPSDTYKKESIDQLLHDFPFLARDEAVAFLKSCSDHYAIAHDKICQAIVGKSQRKTPGLNNEEASCKRLKAVIFERSTSAISLELLHSLARTFDTRITARRMLSWRLRNLVRRRTCPHLTNPILIEEVGYVQRNLQERIGKIEHDIARKEMREVSVQQGTAMECSCCFDQVAVDEMVACRNEAHLFCLDCISQYVESQVFGNGSLGIHPETKEPALEILCCHGSGCSSGFDREYLEKALSPKTLQKYDQLQYETAVASAGLQKEMW